MEYIVVETLQISRALAQVQATVIWIILGNELFERRICGGCAFENLVSVPPVKSSQARPLEPLL